MTQRHRVDTYERLDVMETVRDSLRVLGPFRFFVLVSLILTYVWRFHDLAPIIRPLRLSALATVGSWLFLVGGDRQHLMRRLSDTAYVKLFLAWSAWILVSTFFALEPEYARGLWISDHFKTVTMVLFILSCPPSRSVTRLLIYMMSFGAAVLAFYYAKSGFPAWGSPAPMYDVNDLALLLNAAIPLSLFLALSERSAFSRKMIWMSLLLCAFGVLSTRSRGGFLTLGCISGLLLLDVQVSRWLKLAPFVAMALGFSVLPSETKDRLLTLFDPTDDYNVTAENGRIAIWKRGAGYLLDRPVTGVGFRNFVIAEQTISPMAVQYGARDGKVTHNSLLEVFFETGFVGGLLYVAMIGSVLGRLMRSRRRMKEQRRMENNLTQLCTELLTVSVLAFLVGGFFLALGYTPALFAILTIAVLIYPVDAGPDGASSRSNPPLRHRRQGSRSLRPAL